MTVKSGFDVIKVKLYDINLIVVNDVSLSKENKLVAGSNNGAAVHSTLPIMKNKLMYTLIKTQNHYLLSKIKVNLTIP